MDKYKEVRFENITHCITGEPETIVAQVSIKYDFRASDNFRTPQYLGPGLTDLQVNGINGIDFNSPALDPNDLINANQFLLSKGVTTFFPTIVTNSDENILKMLSAVDRACKSDELLNACVGGIHLEGPFISPVEGAKGAHNEKYIKAPDWELFNKFQNAAGGRIRIVTLAPEWEGASVFIEQCRKQKIIVSIGHSVANHEQIQNAVNAGACMSTHLGNGVPLMLKRHPNIIWEQLAQDDLYTCLIADGLHLPASFLKVVIKVKGNRTLLVSDATIFAGMPPGEYHHNIGGTVIVDEMKRVSMKSTPGLLAGAGKSLPEDIEYLLINRISTISAAWKMASVNVHAMLTETGSLTLDFDSGDFVLFDIHSNQIIVAATIKHGKIIYTREPTG